MLFSHRPDRDEFEATALPHLDDLYRTAARLLPGGAGADDVVQDVYLAAWKSFSRFERGTNCRGVAISDSLPYSPPPSAQVAQFEGKHRAR
jgi:hypothetical protein